MDVALIALSKFVLVSTLFIRGHSREAIALTRNSYMSIRSMSEAIESVNSLEDLPVLLKGPSWR